MDSWHPLLGIGGLSVSVVSSVSVGYSVSVGGERDVPLSKYS